ncbi:MAG: TIGR02757 family protein [Victivallales bacterium]|nr:TIGR02757 family protein [Victivallales bacterium]
MEKWLSEELESVYRRFNKRSLVSPDPLQFLYDYDDPTDREVVGLIAASLAYGRVAQILKSVERVLCEMAPSPAEFLVRNSRRTFEHVFSDFKHRFTTGEDLALLLCGMKTCLEDFGSLERAFMEGYANDDPNVSPALAIFAKRLCRFHPGGKSYLVPSPDRGSACKRPLLFLRWMIRSDEVDPGGWSGVLPSKLIVPLDTHMRAIAIRLGLTERKNADLKCAMEITARFAEIAPDDPVKYDFALTRFGIRGDMSVDDLP